jgi:proteic killer suppression protein
MDIQFRGASLRTSCNESKKGLRKYGSDRFKILRRRLDELRAAERLGELPPAARCHPLSGKREGQCAVLLDGGWRLVFEPANDPAPLLPSGTIDWNRVTAVTVLEVVDYHG